MTTAGDDAFRLREFEVLPSDRTIAGPGGKYSVRQSTMAVLLFLVRHRGAAATTEQVGEVIRTNGGAGESPADCIAELRSCFGDSGDHERFIEDRVDGVRLLVEPIADDDYVFETRDGPIHVHPLSGDGSGDFLLETSSGPVVLHPVSEDAAVAPGGFLSELKRRRVFRVIAAYAVTAWLVLQIVAVLAEAFPVPDWTLAATTISLGIGFPLTAVLSWMFQVTPGGIVHDEGPSREMMVFDRSRLIHYFDLIIIAILLAVIAGLSFGKFFPGPDDERVTIAVLPFEILGEDEPVNYLSEGIADDIRSRLYEVPKLLVAPRTSSRTLFGKGFDIQQIGERLQVENVLEGTVKQQGDRIRVEVQLIDIQSGFNRWSESYSARIDDVLNLQHKVSLVVASELRARLTRDVRKGLAQNVTDDPFAFDLYIQAQDYLDRPRSMEILEEAKNMFEAAIAQDSQFALGYSGLCQTYIAMFRHSGDTTFVPEAESNCAEALVLDSSLSEVHIALGKLHLQSGDIDDAEQAFNSAIEFDTKAIDAYSGLGAVYATQKKTVEAEEQYRKAIELLPANWNGYNSFARFLFQQGRYGEAAANYRRAIELAPDNAHGYNNLGVTYYFMGDFERAADSYRRSLDLAPGRAAYSNTGTMYYYAGNYTEAARMFAKAAEEAETDYRLWGNLADAQRFDETSADNGQSAYRRAIELAILQFQVNEKDYATLTNLAWYEANLGDLDAARDKMSTTREVSPSDSSQQYMAALVYVLLDDTERAVQALSNAVSLGFPQALIDVTPEFQGTSLINND